MGFFSIYLEIELIHVGPISGEMGRVVDSLR